MRKNFISLVVASSLLSILPTKSHALFGFGKASKPSTPLIEASELGNSDYIKQLINEGADINAVDRKGRTALMRAAEAGNDQMIAILITSGADIHMQDKKGNTALHYAAANDHASTTEMLINNGAAVNAENRKGQTPMSLAILNGSVNAIRIIDPGALSVVQTDAGFTAAAATAAGGGFTTTKVVTAATGVAAAGAGIAAAGGGGGGGEETSSSGGGSGSGGGSEDGGNSGGGGGSGGGGVQIPSPDFTAEYNLQGGLAAIKADVAYSRGYTGENILVAVVDTGVDLNRSDLGGNVVTGRSFFNNGSEGKDGAHEGFPIVSDASIQKIIANESNFWHGTHVAGIVAAQRDGFHIHGVAYGAKILPVNVSTDLGNGSAKHIFYDQDIANGIDYSVDRGARVINISLGGELPSPIIKSSIESAVGETGANSVVIVAAAGNLYKEGVPGGLNGTDETFGDDPVYPANYASSSDINPGVPNLDDAIDDGGALLAVAAVNDSNVITNFSNRCGVAKEWCLVAPGDAIWSYLPDTDFINVIYRARVSGTSMAAPHVSGAAAIVMDMSAKNGTQLTGREVAEILLLSATDLGAAGVDDIYGHGLLNLDRATQPIGATSIALGSNVGGSSVGFDVSSINTSSAFGDAFYNSNLSFMVLDNYKRAFYVDLADSNREDNSFTRFENKFRDFANDITQNREEISQGISFAAVNLTDSDPNQEEHEKEEFVRMSLSVNSENGGFEFNNNVPMNQAFRMSALGDVATSMDNVTTNSVLGLISRGVSNNNRYVLDKNSSFSFGSFQGEQEYGDVSGVVGQYDRSNGNLNMTVQLGMMNEESSFLGSNTEGAFAIGEDTPTWFSNFAAAYDTNAGVKLFGSVNYGVSFPEAAAESLINEMSQIQTYSFSAGASKQDVFDRGDKLEFVISQPLRVLDGSANVVLPVARSFDGSITTSAHDISLSPSGRQIDYGAFYTMPLGSKSSFSGGAVYMTQPGHVRDADDEMLMMAKYSIKF